MTNLNKIRLPRHRAYNWGFIFRPHLRALRLFLLGIILGLLLWLGETWYMQNHQLLLSHDNAPLLDTLKRNADRQAERDYAQHFGAPCTTRTDLEEGTCKIELRPITWSGK